MSSATAMGMMTVRQVMPAARAVVITGATIRATTAGRMPLKMLVSVALPLMVSGEKHGNGQDDAERGQDGSQCGDNAATQPTQPVADDRGDVDGEDAGHGLCHGQEVEELVGWQPAVLVDNLTLDDADHGPSATEGEQAYLEESYE